MRYYRSRNGSAGFTLIELSIVMIIIGVITASILSSRELIRNAQIRSVVSQVSDYKIAVKSFEMRYFGLPGDMTNATEYWPGETVDGDGNRQINYVIGVNEDLRAWEQLALAGSISGQFSGQLEGGLLLANTNIPSSPLPRSGYRLTYPGYSVYGRWGNALILGLSGYQFISGATFTSQEAWQMDRKIDDGEPDHGFVYSINGWTGFGAVSDPENPQLNDCVDGAITATDVSYTLGEVQSCTVHFWLEENL